MVASGDFLLSLLSSLMGLILQASGQDLVQAGGLGFNVTKHKLAAFTLSAFFSGLAGALYVFYLSTATVGSLVDVTFGVQLISAAVLGVRRPILGAAVGALFLVAATEARPPPGHLARLVVS